MQPLLPADDAPLLRVEGKRGDGVPLVLDVDADIDLAGFGHVPASAGVGGLPAATPCLLCGTRVEALYASHRAQVPHTHRALCVQRHHLIERLVDGDIADGRAVALKCTHL